MSRAFCLTGGILDWHDIKSCSSKREHRNRKFEVEFSFSGLSYVAGRRELCNVPIQMGRRSAKIATRKGAQDRKKAKLFSKIGKQIAAAVRAGGANPTSNPVLAVLLQQAKDCNTPKDIVERNIKRASEKGQDDFIASTYEAYGFGGVGLVMEVLTDNSNRAAAFIRDVVKKNGGKMADPGSVLYGFNRVGAIYVKSSNVNSDELMLAAMDAGADDVIEPQLGEDDDHEEGCYKILTPVEEVAGIISKFGEVGIQVDKESSGLELIPIVAVEADDEAMDLNKSLIDKLYELDDVDAVYSNQKL